MKYENYTLENNPIAYRIIKNAFVSGKISHAYIFSAPKGYEIESESLFLISKLISKESQRDPLTYPDLTVIDGSKGAILKEQVMLAAEKMQQTTLDSLGIKVLYIKSIENGNSQSLNSLLKFIEEPTKNTFIIMTTNAISQVLSTIRSRSQIITLKSNSRAAFIASLQVKGVPTTKAKIIASFTTSIDKALVLSESEDFEFLTNNLINALSKIVINKEKAHSELVALIKKDSYQSSLGILAAFFNDIWKIQELIELTFEKEKDLISSYQSKHFNYEKAILLISDFLVKINYNVNFDLYKNKFLIELEECYV